MIVVFYPVAVLVHEFVQERGMLDVPTYKYPPEHVQVPLALIAELGGQQTLVDTPLTSPFDTVFPDGH